MNTILVMLYKKHSTNNKKWAEQKKKKTNENCSRIKIVTNSNRFFFLAFVIHIFTNFIFFIDGYSTEWEEYWIGRLHENWKILLWECVWFIWFSFQKRIIIKLLYNRLLLNNFEEVQLFYFHSWKYPPIIE